MIRKPRFITAKQHLKNMEDEKQVMKNVDKTGYTLIRHNESGLLEKVPKRQKLMPIYEWDDNHLHIMVVDGNIGSGKSFFLASLNKIGMPIQREVIDDEMLERIYEDKSQIDQMLLQKDIATSLLRHFDQACQVLKHNHDNGSKTNVICIERGVKGQWPFMNVNFGGLPMHKALLREHLHSVEYMVQALTIALSRATERDVIVHNMYLFKNPDDCRKSIVARNKHSGEVAHCDEEFLEELEDLWCNKWGMRNCVYVGDDIDMDNREANEAWAEKLFRKAKTLPLMRPKLGCHLGDSEILM